MRKTWLIFSQAVTIGVALLFVVSTFKPEWLGRSPGRMLPQIVSISQAPVAVADLPALAASATAAGYRAAARAAAPAVVSIVASKLSPRNPQAACPACDKTRLETHANWPSKRHPAGCHA